MTPEGKVKAAIRETLRKYGDVVYVYMPVPGGYGRTTLDYIGIADGVGFAIEAKRKGGKPTQRQETIIAQIKAAGGRVFVIDGYAGVIELDEWLTTVVGYNMEPR